MPPLYPETDSADVPVELAPDTWLIVPPRGTELPKGSGPGVIVLAHSAHQAETIVKSATTTKTISTGKGATSATKVLQSTTKTIVAKAANNTIWLGKRAETLKGSNRPPIAGEPFALLPDPIKRKRITNAAIAGRLKPEQEEVALRFWKLVDRNNSRRFVTDVSSGTGYDLATRERIAVARSAARLPIGSKWLASAPPPFNVDVTDTPPHGHGRTIQQLLSKSVGLVSHYGKRVVLEVEKHPEDVALALAVTAVLGPEGGAIAFEVLAGAASTGAGVKASLHHQYAEAVLDFASVGLGGQGFASGLAGRVSEKGTAQEAEAIENIFAGLEGTPRASGRSITAADQRALDQAIARRRALRLQIETYRRATKKADREAALLALLALRPDILWGSRQ